MSRMLKIDAEVSQLDAPDGDADGEDASDDNETTGQVVVRRCGRRRAAVADGAASDSGLGAHDGERSDAEAAAVVNDLAHKMDAMMAVLLGRVDAWLGAAVDEDRAAQSFADLLSVFCDLVLRTQRTRHAQFLLFAACSKRPGYTDQFLGLVVHLVLDTKAPVVLRRTAAAYVGSFVARAAFVGIEAVANCLDVLCPFIATCLSKAPSAMAGGRERHALFYSVCQSVMYIFCFRHAELMAMENGRHYVRRLQLDHVLNARLAPLSATLPSVAREARGAASARLHAVRA